MRCKGEIFVENCSMCLAEWLVMLPYCPGQAPLGPRSSITKNWGWLVSQGRCLNCSTISISVQAPSQIQSYQHCPFSHASSSAKAGQSSGKESCNPMQLDVKNVCSYDNMYIPTVKQIYSHQARILHDGQLQRGPCKTIELHVIIGEWVLVWYNTVQNMCITSRFEHGKTKML